MIAGFLLYRIGTGGKHGPDRGGADGPAVQAVGSIGDWGQARDGDRAETQHPANTA